MRTAVLGTGIMGAAMARSLAREGHDVAVWNRTPDRARTVAGGSVTAHGDLSEQARRRADELANDADLRTTVPKQATGCRLEAADLRLEAELADKIIRHAARAYGVARHIPSPQASRLKPSP